MSKIIDMTQGEKEAQESLTILWARGSRQVSRWIFIHLANGLRKKHDSRKRGNDLAEKKYIRAHQLT